MYLQNGIDVTYDIERHGKPPSSERFHEVTEVPDHEENPAISANPILHLDDWVQDLLRETEHERRERYVRSWRGEYLRREQQRIHNTGCL